jgi:hypothetical protein
MLHLAPLDRHCCQKLEGCHRLCSPRRCSDALQDVHHTSVSNSIMAEMDRVNRDFPSPYEQGLPSGSTLSAKDFEVIDS